jgi:hypothetical protein
MKAAPTIPGVFLAERVRGAGRKGFCTPAAFSVQTFSSAARGHFDLMLRTRRDASPPSSGGLLLLSGFRRLLPSWVFSCVARWRGSG